MTELTLALFFIVYVILVGAIAGHMLGKEDAER